MDEVQNADLQGLIERVVRYFGPQEVSLFGSHARGTAGPDSDYNLLVILDDDTPVEMRRLSAGLEARRGWQGAADIVPMTRAGFERRRRISGTLADVAANDGRSVSVRR